MPRPEVDTEPRNRCAVVCDLREAAMQGGLHCGGFLRTARRPWERSPTSRTELLKGLSSNRSSAMFSNRYPPRDGFADHQRLSTSPHPPSLSVEEACAGVAAPLSVLRVGRLAGVLAREFIRTTCGAHTAGWSRSPAQRLDRPLRGSQRSRSYTYMTCSASPPVRFVKPRSSYR